MSRFTIEKDLYGGALSSSLMSEIRAQVLQGHQQGRGGCVDICIRGVDCTSGFPEIIVDYGGEIFKTYGTALRILRDEREKADLRKEFARLCKRMLEL